MKPLDLPSFSPIVASATFNVAVTIMLAGVVSGIVALGVVHIFARERIQRRVLYWFFDRYKDYDSFLSSYSVAWLPFFSPPADQAATLLRMPERLLCRLYYRQISGQFLAAINAEGATTQKRDAQRLLKFFRERANFPEVTDKSHGLEYAVRQIDVLQAYLGDAVSRTVMRWLSLLWFIFFIVIGQMVTSERFAAAMVSGRIGPRIVDRLEFWIPNVLVVVGAATTLALCVAAAGLVLFNWLDRFTALK